MKFPSFFAASALALAAAGASAQDLRIGIASQPSSMDPHYHLLTPNLQISRHIYDTLIAQDARQGLKPGLAESWRALDDKTWEFKLRKGIKFSNGQEFTADDVLFTFERAPNVPRSPASFGLYIKGKTLSKVDDHTIRMTTEAPAPLLPNDVSNVYIISAKAGRDATTEDYNAGKISIGTGPFKQADYVPGERITLVRNEGHWGPKPQWEKVTFRTITSDPTRVAALLAGDLDAIEAVPTPDVAQLKSNPKINVVSEVSNRVIYFHMDHFRDESPFIKARDGSAIKNPLRDKRVRQALSMALNRPAIVQRLMEGQALPAGQLLPDGYFGTSKNIKPTAFDLDGAKKLLAAAGYPNGFKMVMHGPAGRYTNDTKIIEAAAQMFTRLGIEVSVETLPPANFFTRASRGGAGDMPEFSFILVGWSTGTGENSSSIGPLMGTFDAKTGIGAANRGRYSNPAFDALLKQALATIDDEKRARILADATDMAMEDAAIIPLHYQISNWALKKGLTMTGRSDEYLDAAAIRKE